MKKLTYTITDPVGIHARPAGLLVKTARGLGSEVTLVTEDGKSAGGTKLLAIMGLGIKQGDTVAFQVSGGDEEASAVALEKFLKANL